MTRKLSNADRAAVDLLFNQVHGDSGRDGNGGEGVVMMSGAVPDKRLSAVQRILSTLDHLPAPEPSADLVVRTLQKIARQNNEPATQVPATQQPFIDPSAPLA